MSRERSGFSLVEALVALAIASLMLGAIFQLQVQMARSQARAAAVLEQVAAQENALVVVRDINPMERPAGEVRLGDKEVVRWTATPLGEPRLNAGFPLGNGGYDVQLFEVRVEVDRTPRQSPAPLVIERVGWRRSGQELEDAVSGG